MSARAPSGLWVRTIESNNKKQTQTKKKKTLARYDGPSALWPLMPPVDRPRPFRSTTRIDRVMGDPAYDWRRLNQPEGDIPQQSTMTICVEKILHQKRPCNDRLLLPVGRPRPFRSTIERGGCITQQSTMAICEKNTPLTLRRQPINSSTHNNQPTTGGHTGGEDVEEVQRAGGAREARYHRFWRGRSQREEKILNMI